jgi:hypothetical protein
MADYTDVKWDEAGRLIITNKKLIEEIGKYVHGQSHPNARNSSLDRPSETRLFQVRAEPPATQEPIDYICRIIVDFPVPPKKP